jgi:hypothetical protein
MNKMMWGMVALLAVLMPIYAKKLSKDDRVIKASQHSMCKAIISEMFIEIRKHDLRKDGEDDIFETVPAICLGVVQNYTYTDELLVFRGPIDEDGGSMPDIQAMLLVKKSCEVFTELYQQEISGVVYKKVYDSDPESTASIFCDTIQNSQKLEQEKKKRRLESQAGQKKTKKVETTKSEAKQENPSFQQFLDSHDSDGSISALLSMERDSPEKMLPDEDQEAIRTGTPQIQCSVCRAAVKHVKKRASANNGRAFKDEGELSDIVSDICTGQPKCEDVQTRLLDRGSTSKIADVDCVHEGEGESGLKNLTNKNFCLKVYTPQYLATHLHGLLTTELLNRTETGKSISSL